MTAASASARSRWRPADRCVRAVPLWHRQRTRSRRSAPHFPAKAKRVIHLFMAGAPSQLDLFDHKPELAKLEGKPLPPAVIGGQRYAFIRPDAAVLGPQFKFTRHGQSGAEIVRDAAAPREDRR